MVSQTSCCYFKILRHYYQLSIPLILGKNQNFIRILFNFDDHENFQPDLGRSGASPVVGMSPSSLSGSSSSLTERMKLLGKVKKKFKSEEEAANGKLPQQRMPTNQEHKEFSNSRFFKSVFFFVFVPMRLRQLSFSSQWNH